MILLVAALQMHLVSATALCADEWPALPLVDSAVEIPAQEWPQRPGTRRVRVLVHYPAGRIENVNSETGLMLTLHNWGGVDCVGTASPTVLARELNVIAICVNYLQSGKADSIDGPEPYDFGYLQALDALRSLWFVRSSLLERKTPFADDRVFCTGGSGGGNVTLMCNKLAPRTFACVIDLCGMKKLSNDIAFGLPGGSELNARWSRDPDSSGFLSVDEQELRFVAHPNHLVEMKRLGSLSRIVVVHGTEDRTCPFEDAVEMVQLMQDASLDVEQHFVTKEMIDGQAFQSTGHSLGDRTQIVLRVAGEYLKPDGPMSLRRKIACDFEIGESVRYATTNGTFVIDYGNGYPTGSFEKSAGPPEYPDHHLLMEWRDDSGKPHPVTSVQDWAIRKSHIRQHLQRVMGHVPSPLSRVALNPEILEEVRLVPPMVKRPLLRRKITYQSDASDRVSAYLMLPLDGSDDAKPIENCPAVLCLQQTTELGKDETAGLRGDPEMKYALELAEQGFVTLTPDYPSFGEHPYEFGIQSGYASGSMKAVWDNIRAVDLLVALPQVDPNNIGCIGHSLGGHNGIFTAVFEPRLKAVVSSCGFSSLAEDDIPSWTGPRYMPRIESEFHNDRQRLPFDFHELIAAIAPRPFLACVAERDADFKASGVRHVIATAADVYGLFDAKDSLQMMTADLSHSFPERSRNVAYEFLKRNLAP